MKYGYMFYRKPLPALRKERPCNIGDPIQSIAVINLYKEMGIAEEDIIPIDRYDVASYKGEEAIVTINGAENYEHEAYHTDFLPPPSQITPVYFSFFFARECDNKTMDSFRKNGPIGCRDMATYRYFEENNVGAYLTGCVTMTLPRRDVTDKQNTVFMIDTPDSLEKYLPIEIKENAVRLSSVERINSESTSDRMTVEETKAYHERAQQRIELLRDKASLVITGRFHAAVPSLAMGIPVILVKNLFDPRFDFLQKFLPLYSREQFHKINWNPEPVNLEPEKKAIKEAFFSAIRAAEVRIQLKKAISTFNSKQNIEFEWGAVKAISKIRFPSNGCFRYVVWGVCLHTSQILIEQLQKRYPGSELIAMIDTFQAGTYMEKPILQPEQIKNLPEDVIVIVAAPSVQKIACDLMEKSSRRFVLIKGSNAESHHFNFE